MGGLEQVFAGQVDKPDRRQTSVLVARVAGNVKPSEKAHDESRTRCLHALMQAAEVSGGRVLRQQRDTVLVLLGSADSAVAAAARMLAYAGTGGEAVQYGVRIGVASGHVIQRDDQVGGETVNLALQFSREARNGQVLASAATAANLSPAVQKTLGIAAAPEDGARAREIRWRDRTTELLAWQK